MYLLAVDGAVVGSERKVLLARDVDAVLADGGGVLEGAAQRLDLGVGHLR